MKIWPFWKHWYFTRDQRIALVLLCTLIVILVAIRGPVYNYILQQKQKEWAAYNQQEWIKIKNQIFQSKQAARSEAESIKKVDEPEELKNLTVKKEIENASSQKSLEINAATAEEWSSIRGIGPILSERIVKYRNKLGGFHNITQVKEVYGISDSLFYAIKPFLKLNKSKLRRFDPNLADLEFLTAHPYISHTLAKQIIGYRTKVAPFESLEDIRKLYSMNDTLYEKLIPYLLIGE